MPGIEKFTRVRFSILAETFLYKFQSFSYLFNSPGTVEYAFIWRAISRSVENSLGAALSIESRMRQRLSLQGLFLQNKV